ncbi:Anti-sigma factor antagonist [Candidatus Terasakiella magnetica]|uniref:Anti-sigma factor antagonist n=1 Tax=Candidatus Terasakiella magnetica TaxID=1867952 RepID=A0A1C3RJA5_9PROT|nr:STAS domain-containing protein [Candidatus Terasakiella magnetica]SCA57350.1 Anti-sigma factor antagonist [Candidatus Terasakiella magnetica]
MDLTKREENGVIIFELSGEVDLETSPQLRQALLEQVNNGQAVVVGMADVSYIDSSGIASLVEAFQTGRRNTTGFALANISESAMRVLQLARLDKVFTIHGTIDEAVSALNT